jgi:hypothetical protein
VEDRIAHVVPIEQLERLACGKLAEHVGMLEEIQRDVIAVRVDQRHPVRRGAQHVTCPLEGKPFGIHRHLDDGAARERRQDPVDRLDRRDARKPKGSHELGGGDAREDPGRQRWPGHAREHRAEADAGEHRERERHDQAESARRVQQREDRNARIEHTVQPGSRSERSPQRERREAAIQNRHLAPTAACEPPDSGARDAEPEGDEPREERLPPTHDEPQHPRMRAGRGGEVRTPVGRELPCALERPREAGFTLQRQVGEQERQGDHDRDACRRGDGRPVAGIGPPAPHRGDQQDGEADHEHGEDGVVPAEERLESHHRSQRRPAADARPVGDPMEREHAPGQAGRHQQLNVRGMREHVGAIRERDGGDGRRPSIADQIADEVVGAGRAQHKGEEQHEIVGGVRVARRPVDGDRQRACPEIGFRIRQRPAVRMEDVGVEHVQRIGDEGSRDPGDVPDGELTVAVVDASNGAQPKGEREGQQDRERSEPDEHHRQLAPAEVRPCYHAHIIDGVIRHHERGEYHRH